MALTLPNPSIVFVPLDVLTADELNQMVQNTASLAQQFPLATGNISDNAISAAKIATGAIQAAKMATGTDTASVAPTNKNVIRLGNRKIQWGVVDWTNVPSDTDTSKTVTFPEAFNTVPQIIVGLASWIGVAWVEINNSPGKTTKTSFEAVVRHSFGSSAGLSTSYIAIG